MSHDYVYVAKCLFTEKTKFIQKNYVLTLKYPKKPETLVSFITVLTKLFHYDFKQILFVLLNPNRNYALQF